MKESDKAKKKWYQYLNPFYKPEPVEKTYSLETYYESNYQLKGNRDVFTEGSRAPSEKEIKEMFLKPLCVISSPNRTIIVKSSELQAFSFVKRERYVEVKK